MLAFLHVLQFHPFLFKLEQRVVNLSLLSGLTKAKDLLLLGYLMISILVSNAFSLILSFLFPIHFIKVGSAKVKEKPPISQKTLI